ncbi:MAG: response regulator transcription factor [Saprospiraceae bacterium]|nr:response regulator transcription factor [Saprospiraceae bacterium]
MTTYWRNIPWSTLLLYGASLGLLMAALQYSRFRLWMNAEAREWYIGLIALVFAAAGIWLGRSSRQQSEDEIFTPVAPNKTPDELMEQYGITPREMEVLALMAAGLSNQEIAERLFVSINTVKTHSSNVFSKLGVQRRTQAIQKARQTGLIP